MKILVVTNHSGMLYRFRRELIAELLKTNEVVISMPFVGHEQDFAEMGVKCIDTSVDRRGMSFLKDIKLINAYRSIISAEKPDLVLTYSIKANVYAGYIAGRRKIPFYANVQGLGTAFQKPVLSTFVTFLYTLAFKKVRKVFFENQPNADEFVRRKILNKDKEIVLSGAGVNIERFFYQDYPENDKLHFLFAGRIMKEKGMDELFSVVRRLRADGYDFHLDLAGFFEDEYQSAVEQLEKEGIATFHGFSEDLRPLYKGCDCVVMPSYHEGMNNVLLEASASGRASITTDIPGCRESVVDGISGFLCKPKDTDSLYEAMKRFLELPKQDSIDMGKRAREKMEQEFDKRVVVKKVIDTLRGE